MESQRELPFESRSNIPLDPRTKIYLLLTVTTFMTAGSGAIVSNYIRPILALFPFLMLLFSRRWKATITFGLTYDFPSTRRSCIRKGAAMSQAWNGTKKESPERRTYTVEDITQILGIGRTSAYLLVKEGHFKIVRIGNAIRISKRSFDEWLESLDL